MLMFDGTPIHQNDYVETCQVMGKKSLYYSAGLNCGIAVTGRLRVYRHREPITDFIGMAHPLEIPGIVSEEYAAGRIKVRLSHNGFDYHTFEIKNDEWVRYEELPR